MILLVKSCSKYEKTDVLLNVSSITFVSEDGSDYFNISFSDSSNSIMIPIDRYSLEVL